MLGGARYRHVTIDGNGKDDPYSVPRFIGALELGVDSSSGLAVSYGGGRGGKHADVAGSRDSFYSCADVKYGFGIQMDGYGVYSRAMLLDSRVAPFRDVLVTYELLAYLSYRVPKLEYWCEELPTVRRCLKGEPTTKISSVKGNFSVLQVLFCACFGSYNPWF